MPFTAGSKGRISDFVTSSGGSGDANKAPLLSSDGKLDRTFIRSSTGGTAADGALSVSSGTTTIDLGGAQTVVKNYSSISITGTGKVAFSNPHANGSTIILKSQGDVTITSSTAPCLDASGMGASGGSGNGSEFGNGGGGNSAIGIGVATISGGGGGYYNNTGTASTATISFAGSNFLPSVYNGIYPYTCPGSGGGGGANNGTTGGGHGGNGGRGGGVLIIECGGAWNFTTTGGISVAGANGDPGVGATQYHGGGGGGGGGCFIALYQTLTANSGTVLYNQGSTGSPGAQGNGGNPGAQNGNSGIGLGGGAGYSLIAQNTVRP